MRFCLCIFESDTVKSDCPVQIFRKMIKHLKIKYRLLVCHTSFTVFSGDIKKSFENDQLNGHLNDQLNGHFQSFFIYFFSFPRP